MGGRLKIDGGKPTIVRTCAKAAGRESRSHQSRLYAEVYGEEQLNGRVDSVDRANVIHEECREFPKVSFLTEMWERLAFQYDACVSDGIHPIRGKYDECVTFVTIRRYAL